MHALVFLPAGYQGGTTRYPVVYFLHGLPAVSTTYAGNKWLAAELDAVGKPAILVEPQGARDSDADAEYLNWGPGRNWETYVSRDLVDYIDAHFRTIASRAAAAPSSACRRAATAPSSSASTISTASRPSSRGRGTSIRPTRPARSRSTGARTPTRTRRSRR